MEMSSEAVAISIVSATKPAPASRFKSAHMMRFKVVSRELANIVCIFFGSEESTKFGAL